MFNPSQSSYGGYVSDYWGGYRPPVPPPPPPGGPPDDQSHYHGIPPPNPYRQHIRSLPHSLRPPPPPPPPPDGAQRPEDDFQSASETPRQEFLSDDEADDSQSDHSEPASYSKRKPSEPMVGTPLVPRGRESEGPSYGGRSSSKSRRKEKDGEAAPKAARPRTSVYKRPLPVDFDPNLPPELLAKMHNNHCELCDVKLNSRVQSKNHYEGKPHKKKMRMFILDTSRKEGPSAPKLPKIDLAPHKRKSETLDVSNLYCKCCDLSFTSDQHAQQHFMGRNHQRVLHGLKPLKAGYYNKDTGKWQRSPPDPRVSVERIGLDLDSSDDDPDDPAPKKPDEAGKEKKEKKEKDKDKDKDKEKEKERFFCNLCAVAATSKEQLEGHMIGQRHMKNVRATAKKATSTTPGLADSILASVIKADEVKKTKAKDFSIYRTPSGKYYCAPCDITLNSESQFAQHVESKKHKTRRVK